MDSSTGNQAVLWPLLIYAAAVIILVGIMLGLSYLLGQKHEDKDTNVPFEAGMPPTGSAHLRFPVHFYLVAMFFVIFDLEAVFIVAWAIAFRDTGWTGYIGAAVFIVILTAVLVYEWRIGALDFGPSGKKILRAMKQLNGGRGRN
ncbi:MAG: NADH-quinone oxidoreductase subunit A [Syntrophothermus sp.]